VEGQERALGLMAPMTKGAPDMFHFLNRCLRAFVWACWIGAGTALWFQREQARPLVDYFVLWRDVNWSSPAPLPRMSGKVVRILGESIVQLRADDGIVWNLGLQGCETNLPLSGNDGVRFGAETRRRLGTNIEGRPVEFALTITNASRTGLGFFYLEKTNNVLLLLVEEGRCGVKAAETRVLPIQEQYRLRLAERRARANGVGRWSIPIPAP